jgi:hypothetical protein
LFKKQWLIIKERREIRKELYTMFSDDEIIKLKGILDKLETIMHIAGTSL